MPQFFLLPLFSLCWTAGLYSQQDDFPIVADDLEIALFARDPLVRNPCAIAFDAKGRLCVGMGPQYRNPTPETPGDSVWILLDEDRDGVADGRKQFATGFNSIQGLAWKGGDLWIANAPDLTVVRDLDGDDVADEYVRVYTDLGNLEHALHGLNFGPDGKLYMSKGNSKGLTQPPGRVAPQAFRELWGVEVPPGTPDIPLAVTTTAAGYEKNFHDPADDWGLSGGILRCDDDGSGLEIVSRGFRNPWDICFDDGFNWLGTDNDQTMGDKIFAPFFGAHFGWGHMWSYDWKGDDHLPTAPSSGPLFEGSGTGVIFCGLDRYPEKYRGVYLINDWLRREVYVYRPAWRGALRVPEDERFELLAHAGGGRSMPRSDGRAFDPVDIEVGPDGAIWVASWGREYGAEYRDGEVANEGRIYRIWPKSAPPQSWGDEREPLVDLGSHLPVWRTDAQQALIESGQTGALRQLLEQDGLTRALETWAVWTLGRIDPEQAWFTGSLNQRIQSLRLQAMRGGELRDEVRVALRDPEPRIRFEAVLAVRQAGQAAWIPELIALAEREDDRLVSYAIWGALMDLESTDGLRALLDDPRPALRRAALLALLEMDAVEDAEIEERVTDSDPIVAGLAQRRLGGKAVTELRGRPLVARSASASVGERKLPVGVNPFAEIRATSGRAYQVAELAPGVPLYTDRPYRIISVPDELAGEAFMQTANHDADEHSGVEVKAVLKYPSTVFVADDARGERPPGWLRDGWELTRLSIEAEDPGMMRIYRREFQAGEIVFGANRDGVRARKGNYIAIVRPKLLAPDGGVASPEAVLAALPRADAGRGRDLFLSRHGANCAACHRLEGIGNQFAPDLSEIGSRADAGFLIESIIDPSANITEGFAALLVQTKAGVSHIGTVVGETGRRVTLAMAGGAKVEISRSEIAGTEVLDVSAMPAGFDSLLGAQQLADIVVYLLGKRQAGAGAEEPADPADPAGGFSFERDGDSRLALRLGEATVASYVIDDPVLTRRALVDVRTASGIPVTRRFPAPQGSDHTHMHPGIWLGFGWISGNDYWRLQSKVAFEKFLTGPSADGDTASFATRNRYLDQGGGETICVEDCAYQFTRRDDGMLVEIDATYFNDERGFEFGDQEESGLAFRVAEPLSVEFGNGEIVNDRGGRDGAGTWGKVFRWIDYSGVVDGNRVGILLVPHPDNSRASWSHSRDYGVLVANPFPKQPQERREPYVKTPVKKGERLRLRYALLIHETGEGAFDPAAVAAGLIERWRGG